MWSAGNPFWAGLWRSTSPCRSTCGAVLSRGSTSKSAASIAEHEFEPGSVHQLREADADQEIYGLPEWLPAVQSALLNESATLFRRKYYNNGSHAGFILYLSDSKVSDADVASMREALKHARGPGNFRNLFLQSPGGNKDGLKLIPVSEVAAKDEFTGIKSVTGGEMLASLRIPPQLMGIVPQNSGGFGSIREAATVWAAMELEAIQTRMLAINDWLGEEVIAFGDRVLKDGAQVLLFTDWRQLPLTSDALQCAGFTWRGVAVWDKTEGVRPKLGRFHNQAEYIVWGSKEHMLGNRRALVLPGVVRESVRKADKHHMTGKPTPLTRQLVRICEEGGHALAPFAGGGNTLVAVQEEGLGWTGIEIAKHYFDVARDRVGSDRIG